MERLVTFLFDGYDIVYYISTLSWVFIVLVHWNNIPEVNM